MSYDVILYKEIALQLHAGIQNIFNAYQKDFDRGANRRFGLHLWPVATPQLVRRREDQLLTVCRKLRAAPCFAGQGISLSLIRIDGIRNFFENIAFGKS